MGAPVEQLMLLLLLLLLVVQLLTGGPVVGVGVLEELVEEGHLAAGPVAGVIPAHWKMHSIKRFAKFLLQSTEHPG